MNKVPISENFLMPTFQTVNKNQQSTELILMDPQNGSLYLLHQYYCTDSDDYGQLVALLETQAAQGVECPYVLNPVVYLPIKYTNQQFQTSHFVQVLYEYGSHTLQQQLYLRIQQKNYFQEHQIWSILGSCVLGLKNLKDKQFNHSSICLNDIFVTKQGQIKICHPMFRTYDHIYGQKVQESYFQRSLNEHYYFAPQQLPTEKKFGNSRLIAEQLSSQDLFKSDIFSLAMTIVSLSLLHPINDCYVKKGIKNSTRITIQSRRLEQYFNALQQILSQDLVNLLFGMVSYQINERISIDQLACVIQEMIEAKKQEQQKQFLFGSEIKYQEQGKHSIIRKNRPYSQNQQSSNEKFGKFSRVSQASPLSGRKTNRSQNLNGGKLEECGPDSQDKPSIISIQCENDFQNYDKNPSQQENYLNESQSQIIQPLNESIQRRNQQSNQKNTSFDQKNYNQNITESHKDQSQSIDKTLRQYINSQQQQSSVSEVNQTKTYEEYEKNIKNKKTFSPQQVVSVMTSKQLSSLPSDSTSFVVQKHIINNKYMIDKENRPYYGNIASSRFLQMNGLFVNKTQVANNSNLQIRKSLQNSSKGQSHLRLFLHSIKQQNNDAPSTYQTMNQVNHANYISSARTYQQQAQQKKFMNTSIDTNKNFNNLMINKNSNENSIKSSMSISLNKQYDNLLQLQKKNPNNLYTDPQFLQAIRNDVNKILKKRKLKVTSSQNSQNQLNMNLSNNIIINGKKVDNIKPQPFGYMNSINYVGKINNFSHFR